MARIRLPLYGKVLFWFLANLLLLAVLGLLFLRMEFRLSLDWMLAGPGGDRIEHLAEELTEECRATPEDQWTSVLERYSASTGLTLALYGNDGRQVLGSVSEVPPEVRIKLIDKRNANDLPPPPRGDRKPKPREARPPNDAPPKPRFMLRSDHPTRYWAGIHLSLAHGGGPERRPLTLVMISETLSGGGFFFDPWPWIWLASGGLTLSALVWLPLVGGITRAIRRLNEAARSVATGRFEVRVPDQRSDELGELATSVNAMAAQLGDYVAQQRRITSDVAHELCSPIARMQMALGVLEQRGTPEQETYLQKIDAELQHMARLVEEILAFSKAETLPGNEPRVEIDLPGLIEEVVAREAGGQEISLSVPEGAKITSLQGALDRALGNVLRNAVRYAGASGPIRIEVSQQDGQTLVRITDQGPGVTADALPRLFEPFYRPEAARGRHSGGSGLGLAIVKRCVEACGGTVTAALRSPQGLEVVMSLPNLP
ncbi:MAG: HAMP domain-containing sensor histidine kinase [Verrucomicrobiales bacterium]